MPDHRFFNKPHAMTVQEIADATGAELDERSDPDFVLEDIAPLHEAGKTDLSFFDNVKYKDAYMETKAGACIVDPKMALLAPEGTNLIISPNPYLTYALAAQNFYPVALPRERISERATIHVTAKIGKGCVIEAGAVIGANVEIGDSVVIGANTVIDTHSIIGNDVRIGSNTTINYAIIGDHTTIYSGARIGQDGFGFAIDPTAKIKRHIKVPQLGRVLIGSHVEVGANTTIDRGSGSDTVIGDGTWIDNLVQIGHNVKVGNGCIIVSQVGIAGSTVLEDYVILGGQVGLAGHITLGKGTKVAAQSGIMSDLPANSDVMGYPAMPRRKFMKLAAEQRRLVTKKREG